MPSYILAKGIRKPIDTIICNSKYEEVETYILTSWEKLCKPKKKKKTKGIWVLGVNQLHSLYFIFKQIYDV